MTKQEAIRAFGSGAALARALGLTRGAISQWPDVLDQRRGRRFLVNQATRRPPERLPGTRNASLTIPGSHSFLCVRNVGHGRRHRNPETLPNSRPMTCRYTQIDPHDALYNAVRRTPGGVEDLAAFLTARRGAAIHPETLRQRLRQVKGQSMSLPLAELATEWMLEKAGGDEYARDWIIAWPPACCRHRCSMTTR